MFLFILLFILFSCTIENKSSNVVFFYSMQNYFKLKTQHTLFSVISNLSLVFIYCQAGWFMIPCFSYHNCISQYWPQLLYEILPMSCNPRLQLLDSFLVQVSIFVNFALWGFFRHLKPYLFGLMWFKRMSHQFVLQFHVILWCHFNILYTLWWIIWSDSKSCWEICGIGFLNSTCMFRSHTKTWEPQHSKKVGFNACINFPCIVILEKHVMHLLHYFVLLRIFFYLFYI